MTPLDIEQRIIGFIAEYAALEPEEVDVDENLLTSGLVDSIGIMRLIADLEDSLGVQVPPPDLVPENFRTIRTMSAYFGGLRG